MLPSNAKIVTSNVKAIQFDDNNQCIRLWRNILAGGELNWMHPQWECVGEARDQQTLDAFATPEELGEDLDIAVAYFWHDLEQLMEGGATRASSKE